MQDAKKYREYAEECRRIAQHLPPDQKATLLEIANAWIRCAENEERNKK
jgi:phytoene/squalene synthetase